MSQVVLCGTFGNGRDYVIWTMETDEERVKELIALSHLETGIIRRVAQKSDPVVYFYLLAEWEHA